MTMFFLCVYHNLNAAESKQPMWLPGASDVYLRNARQIRCEQLQLARQFD